MNLTRRGLLKGAAAAGAAGAAGRLTLACSKSEPAPPPGPTEARTLHFDLPQAFVTTPGFDVQLNVGASVYTLSRHTAESRARYRAENPFLRTLADDALDDYVPDVAFPSDSPQSFTVSYIRRGSDAADDRRGLLLAGINIPRAAILEAERIRGGDFNLHPQRVVRARLHLLDATLGEETADYVDWEDVARTLIYHHPELISLDGVTAALVLSAIATLPEMTALADVMRNLGALEGPDSDYTGWADAQYSLDFDGNQLPRLDKDGKPIRDSKGDIEYEFDYVPDPSVKAAAGDAIRKALALVRNDEALEGRKFFIAPGFHAVADDEEPPDDGDAGDAEGGSFIRASKPFGQASAYAAAFDREGEWRYGQRVMRTKLDGRTLDVRVDNSYFRHLGIWAAYKDADGKPMPLSALGLAPSGLDTSYCQYLGMIDPPPRIMGAPIIGVDTYGTWTLKLPDAASRISLLTATAAFFDGDLRSEYSGIETPGLGMTLGFEYGFPAFFLAVGAGGQFATTLIQKLAVTLGPPIIQAAFSVGLASKFNNGAARSSLAGVGLTFVNTVTKKLVGGVAACFALGLAEATSYAAAKAAMPLVGWVMFAIDAAVTAAEMITTTVQIGLSRRCVDTTASFTHALEVTIQPDPLHPGAFPQTAKTVNVIAMCSAAQTFTSSTPFDPVNDPVPLVRTFKAIPSGGDVTITVQFLSESGWIAGQGTVKLANLVPAGAQKLAVSITIEERKVPLTATTVYSHAKKLTYDAVAKKHVWLATTVAPNVTQDQIDCRPGVLALCQPTAITFSTASAQLGYAYQAAAPAISSCGAAATAGVQVFLIQSINESKVLGDGTPDAALNVLSCGYTQPVLLTYDLEGAPTGNHFALVPDSGGYTARRVVLGTLDAFTRLDSAPIVGRFSSARLAAVRYHTSGYLVGINADFDKIEVLRIGDKTFTDATLAPIADIVAGRGSARGLINGAVAIACTYTGRTFLVLEGRNQRIQALDDQAAPVPGYFAGPTGWMAPLKAEAGATYLDISVEATGYIYVLSFVGAGTSVNDYRLDIYSPDGSWLTRTQGMVAARLVVDLWRNVYTLNFEKLVAATRVEPSVSQWLPSTP